MRIKYKQCPVCGKQFRVCWTCEKSDATSWKKVADTYEHYSAYVTCVLWKRGQISPEEARQRLQQYDHSDYVEPFVGYVTELGVE